MTIKERILIEISEISYPRVLYQVLEFISLLRKNNTSLVSNRDKVLALAGSLPDEEAKSIQDDLNDEFNEIGRGR